MAASITKTIAELVPSIEQPYAESLVYNAVRKSVDNGQLEFLKTGNLQPVSLTTRYWSRWQKKFTFSETDDQRRLAYMLSKVYWLSGVLGEGAPVWIADPRDAMYLNAREADMLRMAGHEAAEGLMKLDGEFAAATPALMAKAADYQAALAAALDFTKPKFIESMRAGEGNMSAGVRDQGSGVSRVGLAPLLFVVNSHPSGFFAGEHISQETGGISIWRGCGVVRGRRRRSGRRLQRRRRKRQLWRGLRMQALRAGC